MKMNPEEITSIIKERIKNYDVDLNVNDVGTVLEVGDGIAHIYGLDKAMAGELLDFGNDVYGLVLNLTRRSSVRSSRRRPALPTARAFMSRSRPV